ncbi:MAG TPA: methylated-DNA--[protein]-cysteine S-methyltransferase [Planctomycetota bacterium]|nr:methylated-DNA--[protein]-cysteine S-methyltransferase [Planctomycetota bacterium]
MNLFSTAVASPFGPVRVVVDHDEQLVRVDLPGKAPSVDAVEDGARCARAAEQLAEYFAGTRQTFSLDLAPKGTPFQLAVWQALRDIPFGTTITYAELARRVGRPAAVRAVGTANRENPIPIVIPCHRVIGADGKLVGFGGGLALKRALLEHEGLRVLGQGARAWVAGLRRSG